MNYSAEETEALEALAVPLKLNGHAPEPMDPTLVQWARFRDRFAELVNDGFWTLEDLEARIAMHTAFFIPGRDAAMVGMIESYPGGERLFQINWAVGDLQELLSLAPGVEALARMLGCTGVLIEGREGWRRALKPLGYDPLSVILVKRF